MDGRLGDGSAVETRSSLGPIPHVGHVAENQLREVRTAAVLPGAAVQMFLGGVSQDAGDPP